MASLFYAGFFSVCLISFNVLCFFLFLGSLILALSTLPPLPIPIPPPYPRLARPRASHNSPRSPGFKPGHPATPPPTHPPPSYAQKCGGGGREAAARVTSRLSDVTPLRSPPSAPLHHASCDITGHAPRIRLDARTHARTNAQAMAHAYISVT